MGAGGEMPSHSSSTSWAAAATIAGPARFQAPACPNHSARLLDVWQSVLVSLQGGLGGYGTEDESTPARRRYQQAAAAAAVAAAAAAKEQGGVQRSIKFPPLGAPGGAGQGGAGMLRGYGSSSQVGPWGRAWRGSGVRCCLPGPPAACGARAQHPPRPPGLGGLASDAASWATCVHFSPPPAAAAELRHAGAAADGRRAGEWRV